MPGPMNPLLELYPKPKPDPEMQWEDRIFTYDPRLSQLRPGHPGYDQFKRMLQDRSARDAEGSVFSIPGMAWLFEHLPGFRKMPPQKFDGWIDMGRPKATDDTRGWTMHPDELMDRRKDGELAPDES